MPYTVYPRKDADALIKATKEAAAAVKANMNPLKSSDLKKKLAEAGLKAKAKLDLDVAGVRKISIEHFTKIDTLLGQCVGYLKASKDAYNKWLATQDGKDKDMATYGEGIITTTFNIAKQDAMDYGTAWSDYRAFNTGIDPVYSGNFNVEVGKIIAEGKGVTGKIEKMGLLAKEAAAIKKLVLTQHMAPALDIEDHRKNSEELLAEIDSMAKKMVEARQAFSVAEKNASSLANYAKNKAGAIKAELKNHESVYTNLMNLVKRYLASVGSMKKVYDLRLKAFTAEDAKDGVIKTNVGKAKGIITTSESETKRMEGLLQQAVKDMATIRGFFKK